MAKIPGKGTLLKLTIAASLTTIAQIDSISPGSQEQETVECDTLDNTTADIPMQGTGRSTQEKTNCNGYYDPANASQQFVVKQIADGETGAVAGTIVLADSGTTAVGFSAAGLSFGVAEITPSALVKCNIGVIHNGLIDWPQS